MKRVLIFLAVVFAGLFVLRVIIHATTYQAFGTIIPRVETSKKVVALTFDDGPNRKTVAEILDSLGDAKATFFVCGAAVADNPGVLEALVVRGHELANHTMHHDRLIFTTPRHIASEIESDDRVIRAAGWRGPIYYRAPFGNKLLFLPWYLWRHNRIHITWDVDPGSDAHVADFVLRKTRPGSIILLHPWYANTKAARPAIRPIVAGLRARGFEFLTVDQLLAYR